MVIVFPFPDRRSQRPYLVNYLSNNVYKSLQNLVAQKNNANIFISLKISVGQEFVSG